ncbi:MAG: phosphoglycerate mutase family protein [Actinobacteria bacterium]|nr:phosphoglycerate mutase family protein [Actinomycetota bacterium]
MAGTPSPDRLIFVRHGSPLVDVEQPANTWPLSEEGRAASARLAERLRLHAPDLFVSSAEPKASQTAYLLAVALDADFQTAEGLEEHHRSKAGYLDKGTFDDKVRDLFRNPDKRVFGEETANQAANRFAKAVKSVQKLNPRRSLAIVSHGTVISLWLERNAGADGLVTWKMLGLPSFVVYDRKAKKVVELAERA